MTFFILIKDQSEQSKNQRRKEEREEEASYCSSGKREKERSDLPGRKVLKLCFMILLNAFSNVTYLFSLCNLAEIHHSIFKPVFLSVYFYSFFNIQNASFVKISKKGT